ncbi:hypothetical protein LQ564_04330 [Massilia sp. G4R7]|uniref:Uncharacterized protein n=1 Tax=Massilia phyllostachyos TaxID=2898585 RepID=A0ABS8Q1A2_9BURK|nr:hypothetical protein [Massilia phyllostachyos]MCD2515534.1 hypothetical protein [Massilia phyllostachyos]
MSLFVFGSTSVFGLTALRLSMAIGCFDASMVESADYKYDLGVLMRLFVSVVVAMLLFLPQAAIAQSASNPLGECIKDNTTGKDRKLMARWMFMAMSAHPDIQGLSTVSEAARTETDKQVAALVSRLISVTCVGEVRALGKQERKARMEEAFGSLGEVAMLELMSNQNVASSVNNYTQFLDFSKLKDLLQP